MGAQETTSTPETTKTTSLLRPLVEDLEARRAKIRLGGGEEKIAKQHEREKLTARERIALLIDEGTFTELGIHGKPHFSQRAMDGVEAPADGVITGYGKLDGRLVAVCAYDFTVMAGSMGMTGEIKVTRLRELALTKRIPFIWLLDSAGARVQEAAGSLFAGSGHLFREEVVMSGVIPQIAALMGPCAAGTAYIPGLADFVPMVKGRGSMALAGPHLVKAAVGEDVTQEELGGSRVHTRKSGVGDMEVASDEECIEAIKAYISYMPQNCEEALPVRAASDPIDRREEALLDVLPESNRKPYDMYEVIRRITDDGEYFDMKGQWAKTIITCFARFGGRPAGIVANQPKQLGGILDNDSADKAARFVNLCNAFGIPLVFLMDVPGFMVGTKVEAAGIIRHGAKMLYAVANATVPKITVITRKAYGAGLLRDERARVRAGPDRRLAERRDQRDGRRGRRRDRVSQTGRRGRGPRGEEGRADRGLPQDLRRLHRRRERPDRRRDRPARDPRDDLPWAGDVGEQESRAAVEAAGGGAGMSLDDPVVITCSISGAIANRAQCPAIPYTPAEYAAEARRIVDEGGVMIHIHARKPDGTPSYEIEDFQAISDAIRGEVGEAVIVNFSTGTIGVPVAEADRISARLPPRGGGAEHGLDELREVLALEKTVRLQDGLRQPVRRDHRAAGGDERAGNQTGARVLRHRPRGLASRR